MKRLAGSLLFLTIAASFFGESPEATGAAGVLSAVTTGDTIVVESTGGALTYRAVVDRKQGGDITQVSLPAEGGVIARELNDIFFYSTHGEQYTLRGWTGRSKFILDCSIALVSRAPQTVVVQVRVAATGTFKILAEDQTVKAGLRKTLVGYKDRTAEIKRTYTFRPDGVTMDDELVWVYPETELKSVYLMPAFTPGSVQGPARLVKDGVRASFYLTSSGGGKLPKGITYSFTADNFLKNGYLISLRTTGASFDLSQSDRYFYEKTWQQDWHQLSGFIYNLAGYPAGKPITMTNEVRFSKTAAAEGPPIVTIRSPASSARWMDEKGEVPKYKIGDEVMLSAAAVNADGSAIPDQDISWEIHVDPWWNTPPTMLKGAHVRYILPEVTNEEDKLKSKGRDLLAVITAKVTGKNGAESIEPFAMLVGR